MRCEICILAVSYTHLDSEDDSIRDDSNILDIAHFVDLMDPYNGLLKKINKINENLSNELQPSL